MNQNRARRLLIIAFALSLVIHIFVATGVEWPFAPPKEEVTTVQIEHMRTLRVSRLPTPPPHTPPPAPSSRPSPAPTSSTAGTHGNEGKSGNARGGGGTTATPPPTVAPAASPTPNCAINDTPAALLATPAPPDIAPDARGDATSGVTAVRVQLDANGAVQQATVVQSSGNTSLDLVAVSMARAARYAPAMHACKAIAGMYDFKAKWVAW